MLSKYTKWLLIVLGLGVALLLLLGWSSIDLWDDMIPLMVGGGVGILLGAGLVLTDLRAAKHQRLNAAQPEDTAQASLVDPLPDATAGLVNPWGDKPVKQGEVFSYPLRGDAPKAEAAEQTVPDAADADAKEVPAWMRQMPVFARMTAAMHETLVAEDTAAQTPDSGQESVAVMEDILAAEILVESDGWTADAAVGEEPAIEAVSHPAEDATSEAASAPEPMAFAADTEDAVRQVEDEWLVEASADPQDAGVALPDAMAEEESDDPADGAAEKAAGTPWWRTRSESAPWTLGHTVFPATAHLQRDDAPIQAAEDAGETVSRQLSAAPDPAHRIVTETTPRVTAEETDSSLHEVTETTVDVTATVGEFSYFSYPVTIALQPEGTKTVQISESAEAAEQETVESAAAETETAGAVNEPADSEEAHLSEAAGEEQPASDDAVFSLLDADVPRLPVDDPLDEGRGYRSLLEELADRRIQRAEYSAADFPWAVDRTIPSRPMIIPKPLPNIFDAAAWTQAEDEDTPEA